MSENFYDYIHRDNSIEFNNNNNDYMGNIDIKKIHEINSLLNLRGNPIIDLSNLQNLNLNFFIDLIRIIQEDNEKLISNNIEIKQKLLRSDDEILNLKNRLNSNLQEKKVLDDKNQEYKQKINFIESKMKTQACSYEEEKEELNKLILRVTSKETQYKNEINKIKKEQLTYIDKIKNMQEKIDNLMSLNLNSNVNKQNLKNNPNLTASKIGNSTMNMNNSGIIGNNSSCIIIQTGQEHNKDVLVSNLEKDDFLRNSEQFLKSAGALKEFYKLLFKGIESRIRLVMVENDEMKDCIKSLINELMKIIEFKMKTCVKNLEWKPFEFNANREYNNVNNIPNNLYFDYATNNISSQNHNNNLNQNMNKIDEHQENNHLGSFRNYDLLKERNNLNKFLELDREEFITHLNSLLKNFREAFLYDVLKISPENEFSSEYSEITKENQILDNKTQANTLPFYKEIHEFFDYFKKGNFVQMIKNLENVMRDLTKFANDVSEISLTKDILTSHKSNFNNEDLIFNNKGSLNSNSFRNNNNNSNKKDDTLKITLRDNEFDKKFIFNSNKDAQFSDFNSENFNVNNILIKLDDKMHKINSDVKLRIESLENKFLELNNL